MRLCTAIIYQMLEQLNQTLEEEKRTLLLQVNKMLTMFYTHYMHVHNLIPSEVTKTAYVLINAPYVHVHVHDDTYGLIPIFLCCS